VERWMECRRAMTRRKLAGRGWREAVAVIRRETREVAVAASKAPSFKAGQALRARLRKGGPG